ncbi:MAG: Cof-type HAD-IIB family hydrolase [Pyrinomonadaceae bacterium]|nr:Cof-type HAD-IIB family hydrolase [Pyrinomonadaceae bacterium]MCX7639541.1 Cof-type HAD-IIB family hydrolase [Pyrinomonadaceae bacterium]MDW8304408.1 Cof-type HAD-IIB family hydrolase [Acidobacteriota bacterium]
MIRLLGLDLDGTLLDSSGCISEANKRAIRRAEEEGVKVTICTGRRFRDAQPVALELELDLPIISHNGALIKSAATLETFDAAILPAETVRQVIYIARDFDADALVSTDPCGKGTLFYESISEENIPLKKYIAWASRLHGEQARESVQYVEDLESIIDEKQTIHITFSGTCDKMKRLQEVLVAELSSEASILATVYPTPDFALIDVLPPASSKGAGLEKLAKMFGISRDEVMAIGDNLNDFEMLEFAGTPVVMANASRELIEDGRFHCTLSNDEDGVALAIEKFIFGDR